MSQRREGPQNRVELSSVSVVRLKRKGASFEVAAYPNKVRDFRAGVEGDVDEVLQVVSVFSNTVHGVVAPKKQLQKTFPGLSVAQICEEILRRGQLQVSAKEREAETDKLMAEVTNLVASMVVDAQTGSRLAPDAVGRLLRDDAGFTPSTTKSAKRQALDVMKVLERDHGLKRAPMELRVGCASTSLEEVAQALMKVDAAVSTSMKDAALVCLVPPRVYRNIVEAVANVTDGRGTVEVVERSACVEAAALPPPPPQQQQPKPTAPVAPKPRNALACNTCGGAFADAAAHRLHFKSDWHRHNLARKLKKQAPIDETVFAEEQAMAAG